MRVLFVLGSFPELTESFIINQIVSLIDAGVEVNIFSYSKGKSIAAFSPLVKNYRLADRCYYLEKEGPLIARLLSFGKFLLRNIKQIRRKHIHSLKLLYQYQDVLMQNNYDIIHSHYGPISERFSQDFHKTSFFDSAKKLCTFHGWDLAPNSLPQLRNEYGKLLSYYDAFTYNTPYLGNLLHQLRSDLKTYELPVGIQLEFLRSRLNHINRNDGLFKILFCGRLVKWKGCLQLIDIAKALRNRGFANWQIEVIGDGPEFQNLDQKIKHNNLQGYIVLLGKQPQDIVFDRMNASDVFLFPGLYDEENGRAETQGLVIQEAQFFYLPVLVSSAGGAKYGMMDGETGFVVEYGNVEGYADKLIYLMEHREQIKTMGEKGHQYVVRNFSSDVLAQKLLIIYRELLNK